MYGPSARRSSTTRWSEARTRSVATAREHIAHAFADDGLAPGTRGAQEPVAGGEARETGSVWSEHEQVIRETLENTAEVKVHVVLLQHA
jgi:hypothetical protein